MKSLPKGLIGRNSNRSSKASRYFSSVVVVSTSTFPQTINLVSVARRLRGTTNTQGWTSIVLGQRCYSCTQKQTCDRVEARVQPHTSPLRTTRCVRASLCRWITSTWGLREPRLYSVGPLSTLGCIVRTAMKRLTYNNHTDIQDELRNARLSYMGTHERSLVHVRPRAVTFPSIRHCDMDVRLRAWMRSELVPVSCLLFAIHHTSLPRKKRWQNLARDHVPSIAYFLMKKKKKKEAIVLGEKFGLFSFPSVADLISRYRFRSEVWL